MSTNLWLAVYAILHTNIMCLFIWDLLTFSSLYLSIFFILDWRTMEYKTKKTFFILIVIKVSDIPVWLPNRLIFVGLELVFSHTEKSCIVSYYIQFSTNTKCTPVLLARAFGISGLKKTCFNHNCKFLYPQKAVYNTMR